MPWKCSVSDTTSLTHLVSAAVTHVYPSGISWMPRLLSWPQLPFCTCGSYLVCRSLQNSGLTFPGGILDPHNLMCHPKHMISEIPKSPFYLPKCHSHLHHFILHHSPAPSFWTYGFPVFSWFLDFSQNLICSYLQMMVHFKTFNFHRIISPRCVFKILNSIRWVSIKHSDKLISSKIITRYHPPS